MERRVAAGVENPLMDRIFFVHSTELARLGAVRGSLNVIPKESMIHFQKIGREWKRLPGGSCANTLKGIAWVLRNCEQEHLIQFMGAVGKDELGREYRKELEKSGVKALLLEEDCPTGTSFILVDEERKRTMFTYPGASQYADFGQFLNIPLVPPQLFHTTGFMWDTASQKYLIAQMTEQLKREGTLISFDLANPMAVVRYIDLWKAWIPGTVDYLFGNFLELSQLTGGEGVAEVLSLAGELAPVVIMKMGRNGAWVNCEGDIFHSPGKETNVMDITAAGDSFAAGYLAGTLMEMTFVECAELANSLASAVIGVEGCDYEALDPQKLFGKPG